MQINKYLRTTYTGCKYITAGKLYQVLADNSTLYGAVAIQVEE